MKNKIRSISEESLKLLGKAKKRVIYSRFTVDKHDCECKSREKELISKASILNDKQKEEYLEANTPIVCKNIKDKKKFILICPDCKSQVAEVYAVNDKLENYANLHYISWYDKNSWYGAFGVNVNPSTQVVNIECCCGFKEVITNYKTLKIK